MWLLPGIYIYVLKNYINVSNALDNDNDETLGKKVIEKSNERR